MKRILYSLIALVPVFLFSCTGIDNYQTPASRMSGNIIDKTTGQNLVTSQEEFAVRLWETSWSNNPTPQDIPIKQDGSYYNDKLFDATYSMQPYAGPFWPADSIGGVQLKGSFSQDFEVIPYLHITDVTQTLTDDTLKLTCKLQAPVTIGLPMVLDISPFVSATQICGGSSQIPEYANLKYKVQVNQTWSAIGDMNTGIGNKIYIMPGLPLKSGRTYYVRLGVRVQDTYQKYNYSEIFPVDVP